MKKEYYFYLFLLIILGLYYLIKIKNCQESFISNEDKQKLYKKHYGEFKNELEYYNYSNDIDLFVQATNALTKTWVPSGIRNFAETEIDEPSILPEVEKRDHEGITMSTFENYEIDPMMDEQTAMKQDLEELNLELIELTKYPESNNERIKEIQDEIKEIEKLID